jgi:DNA-binding NarL/FixJ family response regulator
MSIGNREEAIMSDELPPKQARVSLIEDHGSFRQALALMLDMEPDFTVVSQAGSLSEARAALVATDLAIVDLALPDGDGADLIAELRRANPDVKILILSATLDEANRVRVMKRGAAGVLDKLAGVDEILEELRRLGTAGEVTDREQT